MSDARAPEVLEPLRFPLRGTALIEASAGTGKTFTIAALYLRLVLGHGGSEAAFHHALTPPEILVVTFTEAATKELRDRIRARLAQAAEAFLQDASGADIADPLLSSLRASYAPAEWPACAQRLRIAAEWMDEAAVSTIHGWCNRMLREHAFDSGSLFSQELEADQSELEEEAVRDYWRTFCYPLDAQDAQSVAEWWSTPADLRQALKNLLPYVDRIDGGLACADALGRAREARARQLAELRGPWKSWCEELQELLDAAYAAGQIDKVRLKKNHYDGWLRQLRDWCAGACDEPVLSKSARERLTTSGLRDVWKKPEQAPQHDALEALHALYEGIRKLPDGRDDILAHAACWVARRLAAEQHRRAQMGFNDLLTQLHAALLGANGERLAALIRTQFPVALIDEFQDTDPVQYGIFRAVYGAQPTPEPTALVLIGDPKQAIYAFRGADIHTYLAARQDTAGRHATLGTNFRSTQAMVRAVNHVFLQAERRPQGEGAFLFNSADHKPLPFFEVGAKGRDESWRVLDADAAALTCWWRDDGEALDDTEYRVAMAAACATEIVRLLQLGQQGRAGFVDAAGKMRVVLPHDIAVLVNNRIEARAVREALGAQGVRSVYLSDQDSVFCSPVAGELQRLLQACASPDDGRLVRAALGTELLALDWPALDRLNQDELHWELRLEQFRGYRQRWQRQGVLPMLRRLLHDFAVPQRLIAAGDERRLTDLLHLAELLQQASALVDGEHALVRHLADQRQDEAMAADNRQLRLESDADLLKVVTVHKSKGLEYPLVFVPFPCACRLVTAQSLPLKFHDESGELQVSLRPDAAMVAAADRERLGEDLRKLYVALTRARFATWIGVAPTKDLQRSAVGYLLAGTGELAPGTLQAVLKARLGDCKDIAVTPAPQASADRYVAQQGAPRLAPEPLLAQAKRERWWIASYSRLRVGDAPHEAVPPWVEPVSETAAEETYLEALGEEGAALREPATPGTLHDFPRGASAGIFLHGLLEWAGRKGFAATAAAPRDVDEMLARRTLPQRWTAHRDALQQWLQRWLDTPMQLERLTPGAAAVAPRELRSVQVEMEFWLGATAFDARALDDLVCAHTLQGVPRARVQPQQLNGMLKGFIDLVFEHEGRYYVADYKSNRLGADDAAYTLQAMRDEVLHHRYELQYCLYLFALHRLLRARVPDYDYERHVGGAVYIFLRGHAATTQGLHLERPPLALLDAMDRLFAGAGVKA